MESVLRTARGRGGGFPLHRKASFRYARRTLLSILSAGLLLGVATVSSALVRIHIYGAVSFPDADPDTTPILGPEDVRIRVMSFGSDRTASWILTMQADADLTAASEVIPASNISWRAAPSPPFRDGVLSTVVPILLGSGSGDTRMWGLLSFYMQNSWSYISGYYSTTAMITLSAP